MKFSGPHLSTSPGKRFPLPFAFFIYLDAQKLHSEHSTDEILTIARIKQRDGVQLHIIYKVLLHLMKAYCG